MMGEGLDDGEGGGAIHGRYLLSLVLGTRQYLLCSAMHFLQLGTIALRYAWHLFPCHYAPLRQGEYS